MSQDEFLWDSPLWYDITGPGHDAKSIFYNAQRDGKLGTWIPVPVTITGAQVTTRVTGGLSRGLHMAKLDLVTLSGSLLDERRLVIQPGLPYADVLQAEIGN